MFPFKHKASSRHRLAIVLALSLFVGGWSDGSSLNQNNILVVVGTPTAGGPAVSPNTVFEFTPSGNLVQKIPFNYNGGSYPGFEHLRDIVVDSSGAIDAVNGFYNLFLTRYFPNSRTFVHRTFPNWASFTGRLATYQNFIFFQDNSGSALNPPGGVQRFNTSDNSVVRLGGHGLVLGLAMGLDGRLYATYDPTGSGTQPISVDVYNPVTGV